MNWLLYMVFFMVILYFFMIAPQRKQAKERQTLIDSLRAGDRVVTLGGVFGRIRAIKDRSVLLEVAPGVKIEVLKTGIGYIEPAENVEAHEELTQASEPIDEKKDE